MNINLLKARDIIDKKVKPDKEVINPINHLN
jgi:hypothetical protein